MSFRMPAVPALLLLPSISMAQADALTTLPEVVISSGIHVEDERSRATSSFTIDEETIRRSPAQNLSELLIETGLVTVEATPTDHGENTTLLRGFQTEHLMTEANGKLLVLIDGRRSGVANTRQIALGNIERVEILRGPEMFQYSMGSPGGIINVITRRGGPERFSGSARLGYGSYGSARAGIDVDGRSGAFDYVVGYEHGTVRNDYRDGDGKRVHNTRTDGTDRFNFDLGYHLNERHRIGIDGYLFQVDKSHRPSYVDEEGEIRSASYTDRETRLLHLNYEGASEDGRFSWRGNIGQGKDLYETFSAGSTYPKGQEAKTKRAQGSLTYTTGRFDVTGGLDYIKYDIGNSSSARGAFLQNGGLDPVWAGLGYPMHPTSSTTLWGAFLVGTLKLNDGALNLSGGLRYEQAEARDRSVGDEHYDRVPYFISRGITDRSELPTRRSFDHVSPTLGVTWLPADGVKLRTNFTQGWRAPSGRQLFASSFYEDYGAPGDPRLDPEFTNAFEAGIDLARDAWRLSGTFFHYRIKDNVYIYPGVRTNGAGAQGRVMMNADKRIQEGVEIQASTRMRGFAGLTFRPYLNIVHMTRKDEVIEEGGPGMLGQWWPITRMPDTTVGAGLRFDHPATKLSGNLNFNYYGKQYGGRANVSDGPLQGFGKFTVANLSVRKRLADFSGSNSLDLKVDINNLFDKTYSYLGRIPDDAYAYPGRNFHAMLIYNF